MPTPVITPTQAEMLVAFARDICLIATDVPKLREARRALVTRYEAEGLLPGSARTYAGMVRAFLHKFAVALGDEREPAAICSALDSAYLGGGRMLAAVFRSHPDSLREMTPAWNIIVSIGQGEIVSPVQTIPDPVRHAYSQIYLSIPKVSVKYAASMIMSDVCVRRAGLMIRSPGGKLSDITRISRDEAVEYLALIAAWRKAPYASALLFAYPGETKFSVDTLHSLEMGTWEAQRIEANGYFTFYGAIEGEEDYNPDRHESWLASRNDHAFTQGDHAFTRNDHVFAAAAEGASPRLRRDVSSELESSELESNELEGNDDEFEDFDLGDSLLGEGGLLGGAVKPTAPARDVFTLLDEDAREDKGENT